MGVFKVYYGISVFSDCICVYEGGAIAHTTFVTICELGYDL